ncbi:hypothetical protein AAES_156054 [Amazona aestiva]|uniref:Uncharacterized protein n=1 Tax=Amazona aestiva TaxID=12930 RepID=A0A0Q3UQ61_AMAAE|nr:hypothetical protein AAES_156054 [Amazona aestiva]
MTTQPEGQPPVGTCSDTPEHLHQQLQSRVTLDLRRPDKLSAVRTNQYSLDPPFMMPILLMVSQPFRMTCAEIPGFRVYLKKRSSKVCYKAGLKRKKEKRVTKEKVISTTV